jgi:hypothetical protein
MQPVAKKLYAAVDPKALPPQQGPGKWVPKSEYMPEGAAAHQQRVTGVPPGQVYVMNGVEYDGIVNRNGQLVLVEAKDLYEQFFPQPWFNWEKEVTAKVLRQAEAARNARIPFEVHCSEKAVADRIRAALVKAGYPPSTVP